MYKNILGLQIKEFNELYKFINKKVPGLSITEKQGFAFRGMLEKRGLSDWKKYSRLDGEIDKQFQYFMEVFAVELDIDGHLDRYYIKDDSLFDFFKNTQVKQKEIQSTLDSLDLQGVIGVWGILGQSFSCTILYAKQKSDGYHFITVLTDTMNYTFCVESCKEDKNKWVFNLAMNFLFYINAFPECVIDGVPNGVKKNPKAKSISISEKIVSHTTVEHGFVRPHFRSGYFRHLNSDYFVNCKGQVRFIASTMVKGKAKTVISQGENK